MYEMVDVKKTYSSGRRVTLESTLRPFSFRFLSLSVFVYSRPAHLLAAMSMPHSRSEVILSNHDFEVEAVSSDQPMWLYCRHKQTSSGTAYSSADPVERTLAGLSREFGLDEIKVAEYLAGSESYGYSLVKTAWPGRWGWRNSWTGFGRRSSSRPGTRPSWRGCGGSRRNWPCSSGGSPTA
jgi:hypothetical protein